MSTATLEMPTAGSQVPRTLIAPNPAAGYYADHAEDAVEYAAFYKLRADPWQATTCEAWLRQDISTGRWLASTWVVTVSRQNGKNGALEIVELYGMAELGLKFLHTAHEVKTARKAFRRLKYFFGEKANDPNANFPELNAMVKEIRNTNGQEAIELRNGGSVEFIARSKGSGRGFTVDILVCDEAQDLTDDELEALQPTISAAPSGQAITIMMGTPPKEISAQGEPFVRARDKAISGEDTRVAWVEFSAEGEVDDMTQTELERFVRDPRNWADANPAWGIRIGRDTIEAELTRFNPRSFARERLNMWPKSGAAARVAIDLDKWGKLKIPGAGEDWKVLAYGLDMNPARTKVTISVVADPGYEGAPLHLELAVDDPFDEAGTSAVVEWLWVRAKRITPIVIDALSPARTFEAHLKKKKMKVYVLNTPEYVGACQSIHDAVLKDKSVTHSDQDRLNDSLKGIFKEPVGEAGAFKFSRVSTETDLGPIMATLCAHYGAIKFARRRRAGSQEKKRSAVVF